MPPVCFSFSSACSGSWWGSPPSQPQPWVLGRKQEFQNSSHVSGIPCLPQGVSPDFMELWSRKLWGFRAEPGDSCRLTPVIPGYILPNPSGGSFSCGWGAAGILQEKCTWRNVSFWHICHPLHSHPCTSQALVTPIPIPKGGVPHPWLRKYNLQCESPPETKQRNTLGEAKFAL